MAKVRPKPARNPGRSSWSKGEISRYNGIAIPSQYYLSLIGAIPISLCNGDRSIPVQLALLPLRQVIGRVLQRSQPDRSKSDSERVTAISTRNAPSVSTDRPGTGSDRCWVRSFANTEFGARKLKSNRQEEGEEKRKMKC